MKLHKQVIGALILMTALCIPSIAQTSGQSIQDKSSAGASDEQLVAALIAEVKSGRAAVAELRQENETLRAQVDVEKARGDSLQRSYDGAVREIAANERAIKHLETAISLHEKTIATLQGAYDKEKASNAKNKKRAAVATVIAVALTLIRFL